MKIKTITVFVTAFLMLSVVPAFVNHAEHRDGDRGHGGGRDGPEWRGGGGWYGGWGYSVGPGLYLGWPFPVYPPLPTQWYCQNPPGYYPWVPQCAVPWIPVQ